MKLEDIFSQLSLWMVNLCLTLFASILCYIYMCAWIRSTVQCTQFLKGKRQGKTVPTNTNAPIGVRLYIL